MDRELIAYLLVGAILVAGAIGAGIGWHRRRRAKLRRRGIKRYGH